VDGVGPVQAGPPVIQIDGLHIGNDLVLVAALGIDGEGHKHPLALIEGATENAAVVKALIDNLIERGLDPKVCRLFIIDGAKALSSIVCRRRLDQQYERAILSLQDSERRCSILR
jgi:hypothetical protein